MISATSGLAWCALAAAFAEGDFRLTIRVLHMESMTDIPPAGARQRTALILDAALDLFATNGFATTSMPMIAERTGLEEEALRACFPSTRAIYRELFERYGPISAEVLRIDPAALGRRTPYEVLPELIDRMVADWSSHRARQFVTITGMEPAKDEDILSLDEAKWVTGQLFDVWQGRGLLRGDLSPEQLGWELFAPLWWLRTRLLRIGGDTGRAHRAMRKHLSFFLTVTRPGN